MQIPNNFTQKTQELLALAKSKAVSMQNQQISSGHVVLAFLEQDGTLIQPLLSKLNISESAIIELGNQLCEKIPKVNGGEVYASDDLRKLLSLASKKAEQLGDSYISVEHIFWAFVEIFEVSGIDSKELGEVILEVRGGHGVADEHPEDKFRALEKYCINFTELARKGKIDPVIGRNEEIRRVMQILARRSKNNPVLIGEPGTGKTAIVEGLAHRIINNDVPDTLRGKEILSLDLGAMVAGAKYRGEFEDRLKAVLKEIDLSNGKVVLFIDELHTLVGAGAQEGQMDASNMLKPALARGELRTIGATTLKEYQKYIEKDAALERRFQPIYVEEPSVEDAIAILRGIKEKYELFHKVKIRDEAIIAAVTLSHRYITDRFLPDKAVDLMDEATAVLKIDLESSPSEIDELEREVMRLEIEEAALSREADSEEKLVKVRQKIADKKEQLTALKLVWQNEKELIDSINNKKAEIDKLNMEAANYEREANLGKVAEIQYGLIPDLKKEISELETKLGKMKEGSRMLKEEVTAEDIGMVVSRWTGIPVNKLNKSESQKYLQIEDALRQNVVGQDEAVTAVANVIRRSKANISEENRPLGSFIFLGPTGVGKTEMAKNLALQLFDSTEAMIRLDMSEFMEAHSVSKLIGSPPGYVGFEDGGQLTERIRKRPYSVILFDEVEKAHPSVFNMLLQVLDEGHLTDSKGRKVNFKNTVVILTSNIGSKEILNFKGDRNDLNSLMRVELAKFFRPEFINRVDNIVVFNKLELEQVCDIAKIQLVKLSERLKKQEIELSYSDDVIKYFAKNGYDPAFGARPLKRLIQEELENPIAVLIIGDELKESRRIQLKTEKNKLKIVY